MDHTWWSLSGDVIPDKMVITNCMGQFNQTEREHPIPESLLLGVACRWCPSHGRLFTPPLITSAIIKCQNYMLCQITIRCLVTVSQKISENRVLPWKGWGVQILELGKSDTFHSAMSFLGYDQMCLLMTLFTPTIFTSPPSFQQKGILSKHQSDAVG